MSDGGAGLVVIGGGRFVSLHVGGQYWGGTEIVLKRLSGVLKNINNKPGFISNAAKR